MPAHNEAQTLPFTPAQMYALVMDIEHYPEFLPWCLGCRIVERSDAPSPFGDGFLLADMIVGYKIFREKFRSRVRFVHDKAIHIEYLDGPLKHLKNDWEFSAEGNGCRVNFHIDFEFSNRLLQSVAETFFDKALGKMMIAFETRAADIFPPIG